MSALIEDLLTYSRLGRHAMRLQGVDMQALVNEVRIALDARRARSAASIWRIAPLPVVVADENMIRLVWQNLIDNAIKYTAPRARARSSRSASARRRRSNATFCVRDNGVGFDMAYADKLFGVFQRLHKAVGIRGHRHRPCHRCAASSRRHGGRTWAESEPDHGATFHLFLAAQPESG